MAISGSYSTLQMSITSRNRVSDISQQISTATNEMSTGLHADVHRELGVRSAQTLELRNMMQRNDNFALNNTMIEGKLKIQEDALSNIHESLQSFMNLAIRSSIEPDQVAVTLQKQANATLDLIYSNANTTYAGEYIFSGTSSEIRPLQDRRTINPATGLSPDDVMTGLVGGAVTTPADAASKIALIDARFASTSAVPAENYEATFYNGTPELDALGNPSPRVSARIDEGLSLTYGVQANDPAIREAIKGLMMFASVDVTTINDETAYSDWVGDAMSSLSNGLQGLDAMRVDVGSDRRAVTEKITSQRDISAIYNNRIFALEGVDPYEAATRVESLRVMMEATYTATARIASMSILNHMR